MITDVKPERSYGPRLRAHGSAYGSGSARSCPNPTLLDIAHGSAPKPGSGRALP
jgi:hypothetical protein